MGNEKSKQLDSAANGGVADSEAPLVNIDQISADVRALWTKSFKDLPVGKDLPRLARKLRVYNREGEVINWYESTSSSLPASGGVVLSLFSVISAVTRTLEGNIMLRNPPGGASASSGSSVSADTTHVRVCSHSSSGSSVGTDGHLLDTVVRDEEHQQQQGNQHGGHHRRTSSGSRAVASVVQQYTHLFEHIISPNATASIQVPLDQFRTEIDISDHASLNSFFFRYFGEESRTMKLLKACNQSILAPAITNLKKGLYGKLQYKDVPGGWTIHMFLGSDTVRVTHRRKEQVTQQRPEDLQILRCFQFEWELVIDFDSREEMNDIESVSLRLVGLDFSESDIDITEEYQQQTERLLRSFLEDNKKGAASLRDSFASERRADTPKKSRKSDPSAGTRVKFPSDDRKRSKSVHASK